MIIKIYMSTAKYHWERDLLRRWYDAVKTFSRNNEDKNIDVDFEYGDRPVKNTDVGIVYGGARYAKGHHEIRRSIMEGCKTFIINETPILGRTMTKEHHWHRIGVNGHLYGEGNFNAHNCDSKRIEKYKNLWNLREAPWKNNQNGHIVLALQLPGDSSLRKQDLSEWAISTISELRKHTNKEIRIRTHPLFSNDDHSQIINLYQFILQKNYDNVNFSYGNSISWDKDLENCYCVVAFTSGLSIDSIDNGIPVIAMDQGNFAYDISSHYPCDINNLKIAGVSDKKQWYNNLSYCQWSNEEILNGLPLKHLFPVIEDYLKKYEDAMNLS